MVINSDLPLQYTIPDFLNNARTTSSEVAKAPVCEEAALPPAADVPALIAAILQPFYINDEACM
jgi:hypothetical protein